EARPQSRPYMACLKIQRGASYIHCGGFLVSENFVLTAAHCQGDNITVILGAHNVWKWEPSQQRIRVRRQIPHPQYNSKTLKNDIMLLELEKPAKLNGDVKIIPLPRMGECVKPGMVGSVAGWGCTVAAAKVLQEVDVEVVVDNKCLVYDYYDRATMLCAEHPQQWEDIVPGDSGGPLVCDGKAQGIASRGSRPGKIPGTYTRVSAFIGWIHKEMGVTAQP
uniref:Peptidase S1 domain-containing protein n=1 Tax=Pelodiscus sinensis TaxID=13735 RepID=K7FWA6_PELSI